MNDKPKLSSSTGLPDNWYVNYASNVGVWLEWDPAKQQGGDGAFYPNSKLRPASFSDGMSKTVCFSEVKAFNPGFQNAALMNPTKPATPAYVCTLGGTFKAEYAHQEWTDGQLKETCYTALFPPNTKVLCTSGGKEYDVDWQNAKEVITSMSPPTYAVMTSRSWHSGLVNVNMMDGSVQSVSDNIDAAVWQAMATRSSRESVNAP